MKKRYLLAAAILGGLGVFCYLFVYGYEFTGILLCGGAVLALVFGLLNMLKRKIFTVLFSAFLCLLAVILIGTGVWVYQNMSAPNGTQAKYVVVLGAAVNDTEPSISLAERIEAAANYAKAHPNAVLILSGGKSEEDSISEAQCMFNELVSRGIPARQLLKEENATTTQENLQFAVDLIRSKGGKAVDAIAVVSSEYHIPRATLIAEELGIEVFGVPAKTQNGLYFCNMFIREIFAVWKELI